MRESLTPSSTSDDQTHQHIHSRAAFAGIVLSLATLPIHLLLDPQRSVEISAVVVAMIGAIYIGFALQKGTVRQIAVEALVAACFFAAALAGLWWNPWVIPLAYVAHGLWDSYHHVRSRGLVAIPRWYPPFCAAFDWIYAAGLTILWLTITPL